MDRTDENILKGFHVSSTARDFYQFERALFSLIGKTVIPDFYTARQFAAQMNQRRDLVNFPEQAIQASQINAVSLIHGILQFMFRRYRQQVNPQTLQQAYDRLQTAIGPHLDETLERFVEEFPPLRVYLRDMTAKQFLTETIDGVPSRELVIEEMLLLWLSNLNPAFSPFLELFGDDQLELRTAYNRVIAELQTYFDDQRDQGGGQFTGGMSIIDLLMLPMKTAPHSLEAQLNFLLGTWGSYLGNFIYALLRSMDFIKEEEIRPGFGGFVGGANMPIPTFEGVYDVELERFTPDREWMPNLVLIAKNAYVWLDQLSKLYDRPITRLDQIPDEELERLSRWGVTGLWLIGLWERSKASQTIKQLMGNADAVASAYSLLGYQIAEMLGGREACDRLRERAWKHGIRLASDMVPNHVGIDGQWVMEHPDWFVQLPYSPYPNYTFNGPNLSWNDRVGIYIEDHYFDRSDAAVVFKRLDHETGDVRYIYHGNDGTTMPWNDTAQLNYLNPAVREAMIQTILDIAKQFPIIRFDAAMTLVKRHYHRLWYPEPGSGGAIPSRAEHGMTRAYFDEVMPEEFWREVVDRAAIEAPDTLLLAEAFWLMESYFVRTLGMHRVYNSAYMNMMRDEENAKYRLLIKNTLEFDPEILKRYVNFMNNPDERTAVEQFGKGDKYFGICTVMMTLPGLPMLGHGQIEGYSEKYGMEYRRAYYDESPDQYLIQRHEREIFPLARKRYLFAGVEHFLLYDFYRGEGGVDENVFAYSNRHGEERSLVLFNNGPNQTRGWLRISAAFSVKTGNGDERALVQRTIGEGLGLPPDLKQFVIFRDHHTGLEYIRNSKTICDQGLYMELGGYHYRILWDFRIVQDDGRYSMIENYLGGRGVPSIEDALREILLQPIHQPLRRLINAETFSIWFDLDTEFASKAVEAEIQTILEAIEHFAEVGTIEHAQTLALEAVILIEAARAAADPEHPLLTDPALIELQTTMLADPPLWYALYSWILLHDLGKLNATTDYAQRARSWIDEWLLGRVISSALQESGLDEFNANQWVYLVKAAVAQPELFIGQIDQSVEMVLNPLLQDGDIQRFLRINRFQDVLWFDKEAFGRLLQFMVLMTFVEVGTMATPDREALIAHRGQLVARLTAAEEKSGYQVEKLRAAAAVTTDSAATPTPEKPSLNPL
ncbi:MAG: alpha-amylase family glycosyl hydrolase [Anaerolineae bacterium]|jgi:glycosidase|nr:alpha-amylase family glycosyl hydrolase [Anaerolineae bacterium]